MIRVVLVDDQTLVRSGITGLLALTEDIRVVAEAADITSALGVIEEHQPDILLLDVRMPGGSGLDLMAELEQRAALPATILLTTFDDDEVLLKGLRLGARGFLLKDVSLDDLAHAIRRVCAGGMAVRLGLTERVVQSVANWQDDFEQLDFPDPLTAREVEILSLITSGLSNREIAEVLGTSEGTVKNQVSSILSKLGVRDRVRAVLRGINLGLVNVKPR